ncbi:MAG: sulfurtransferase [Pseudomonadota bacterium]|nr:sulfurtransferase [Pseudomonadota bacterium]
MPYQHPEYLISAAELNARIDDPDLRVYDSTVYLRPSEKGPYSAESGEQTFRAGHVPGAMFLDLINAASDTTTGLGFSLPIPGQLESLFQDLGIERESEVVIYSTDNMMWATRAWWLLHYCGHPNVRVLNGGYRAWVASDLDVSDQTTAYPEGSFTVDVNVDRFADKDAVFDAIGDDAVCTVNALAPSMHSGESAVSYGRPGHIAGSINVFYDDLLLDGHFRRSEDLVAVLANKGLLQAPKVISYCGGGIAATIDAFACMLVGQEQVAVYDGSMSEWVKDASLPLELGP